MWNLLVRAPKAAMAQFDFGQTKFCHVEVQDKTLIVTLTRVDRLNALHPPAWDELNSVFEWFVNSHRSLTNKV